MITEKNLNSDQKAIVEAAMAGDDICLLASGGTGKTVVLRTIIDKMKKMQKNVAIVAPTGRAADEVGGVTLHKAFGYQPGVALKENGKPQAHAPKTIQYTDVLIIDEVSMVRLDYMDSVVDSIYKANKIRHDRLGRQKIQLILSGDFFQLPPVVTKAEKAVLEAAYGKDVRSGYPFMGKRWDELDLHYMTLNRAMRQGDAELVENLRKLRMGDESCIDYFNDNSALQKNEDAITLYPYKDQVRRENLRRLSNLDGPEFVFDAVCHGGDGSEDLFGLSASLHVKIGMPALFVRNQTSNENVELLEALLSNRPTPSSGLYVNGDIGTIVDVERADKPEDECIVIAVNGKEIRLYRQLIKDYSLTVRKDRLGKEAKTTVFQFPIVPAFSTTIHKVQGMTLNKVNVDPRTFAAGQLYVAMSRCRDIKGIYLTGPILPENIIADKDVMQFYNRIGVKY